MDRPNTRQATETRGTYRPGVSFCLRTPMARGTKRDIRPKRRQSSGLVCRAVSTTPDVVVLDRIGETFMPEAAISEFWRDLKPISKVFQPDALPEVYLANAPTDDDRYYVPFTE